MIRIALCAALAVMGCKSKSKAGGGGSGQGSGQAVGSGAGSATTVTVVAPTGAVPALRWTDPDGDLLLATGNGETIESACGLTGTITATEVDLGPGTKQPWTSVLRDGRAFSIPKLDWKIEVAPTGEVTHKRGGTDTPLGKVTGVDTDDALAWFAALVIAAPMIQHKVTLASLDGTYELVVAGSADVRAWDVRGAGGERIAARKRDDKAPVLQATKPSFDPTTVTVTAGAAGSYAIAIADDPATRAAFPAAAYTVTEQPDGQLVWGPEGQPPQPLAKLVGRATCAAHDRAVAALLWAMLVTDDGRRLADPTRKPWQK